MDNYLEEPEELSRWGELCEATENYVTAQVRTNLVGPSETKDYYIRAKKRVKNFLSEGRIAEGRIAELEAGLWKTLTELLGGEIER